MNDTITDDNDPYATEPVLRELARKANGLSGADVERLVREARQKARRAGRPVLWQDLDSLIVATKPEKSDALRWLMAVHEAGHAVARLAFNLGTLTMITIDGPSGSGFVKGIETGTAQTERELMQTLTVKLAGRAAEEIIVGTAMAGAGLGSESDLSIATDLACMMELSFGFAETLPLLHRPAADRASLLAYHPEIAHRVHGRLERAYKQARTLIEVNRGPVEVIANALVARDTLEGQELSALIEQLRPLRAEFGEAERT